MTFQLGVMQLGMLGEAVGRKSMGRGATNQEWLQCCLRFPDHGVELAAGSMTDHLRRLHGTDQAINWEHLLVSQTENPPQVYEFTFPNVMTECLCPFPG